MVFITRTRTLCVCFAVAMAAVMPTRSAFAYTPESPEVRTMIDRGVAFIAENLGKSGGAHEEELGAICICALACLKAKGEDHPLVAKAVAEIRKELQEGMKHTSHANYSLGIAMIFLGELNPETFRPEIEAMLQEVYKRQMPYGAWSYPSDPLGDVSQTQYAVLGMWLAHRQGIQVDQQVVERVCNWLLRIQEPSGVFPYKGKDPGSFTRVEQEVQSSASMCASGVGSLYVCGELLGFIDDPRTMRMRVRLPPVIVPVKAGRSRSVARIVDEALWQKAVNDGNNWMGQNGRVENFDEYHKAGYQQYYYMYGVERYWAFRELAEGIDTEEPPWYNAGVEYLQRKQSAKGSWQSTSGPSNGPVIDTAFGVMFLLRSSKATVTRLVIEVGALIGGKGLDADLSAASVDAKGTVVTPSAEESVNKLLEMLDDPELQGDELSKVPDRIPLPEDLKERSQVLARVRRMLMGGPYEVRRAAARTLSTTRDLDSAPYLIYALSDPDRDVVEAANNALCFMSRRASGVGFKVGTERPDRTVWEKAQADWTKWLLSVKPDAELID